MVHLTLEYILNYYFQTYSLLCMLVKKLFPISGELTRFKLHSFHYELYMINQLIDFLDVSGMQEDTIFAPNTWAVGLNETFLPQVLKGQGYATHAVGKVRERCFLFVFLVIFLCQYYVLCQSVFPIEI